MKEIGGYIEFEHYEGPLLHDKAIALNCGRNALACLFKAKRIRKVWIPRFLCDSVAGVCKREHVEYELYSVGFDFLPAQKITIGSGEWLYLVNYYGQLSNLVIEKYKREYDRLIVDNAQSYFQAPVNNVDTIYSCRKYFGVADGAFLYTDPAIPVALPQDESFKRMRFLLGRFERSASEFYREYVANNDSFADEPVKRMSKLTDNLLRGIDYPRVRACRENNFQVLHELLGGINRLDLTVVPGTFMYPFYLENGNRIRTRLQKRNIYIPTLWPNVCETGGIESRMAENILPLPIDQRYDENDLKYMAEIIFEVMKEEK